MWEGGLSSKDGGFSDFLAMEPSELRVFGVIELVIGPPAWVEVGVGEAVTAAVRGGV
jgi:hypothetical protein